jgi:glycosyltransferase involved in cell wall biosynthesis
MHRLAIMLDAMWHQQGDVNHVTGDITFAAILLKKRKTVVTILDCIDVDTRKGIGGWLYRKLWFEWPVARSQFVTTISEASKRDIVRLTGCSPEKVVVTGVAISTRYKREDRDFNMACPTILQIGTASNKNIERLAAALEMIPCRLIVVGELSESQQHALTKHSIEFENHLRLSDDELLLKYIQCDIVAFVSTFEGFGMPILEGNAVGRVVVTSNCTSMPEVAGDAACLVDPTSIESIRCGFQRVISDCSYRESLIAAGYENAKRFNAEAIAHKYLAIYQQIMC